MNALVEEAKSLLGRMSIEEKDAILQELSHESRMVGPGVWKTPDVCGGAACVGNTRIAVWMLWQSKLSGDTDENLLRSYPHLSEANLTNAWRYAESHSVEIEREIEENESA